MKKLLILVITFLLFSSTAQAADNRLFHNPGLGFDNTLSGEAMLSEQMIVYVDFNVLKGEDGYVPVLLLELFGQSFQVGQTRVDERGLTDYAWCGKASGDPISNVVLTISDKTMFGRIEYLDCVYKVEPVGEGSLHRITKLDPTKVMPLENDALISPQKLEQNGIAPQGSSQKPLSATLDDGSVIDIMVLYTEGMATTYPGTLIDTLINYLVDLANQAYINSQINTRLRIVKTQQVSYTDGDSLVTAIVELTDGTGVFSNVATWRNTYGADVVTLLRKYQDSNDSCGVAWLMASHQINSSFAPLAFSVVQEGSRTGGGFCDDYSLAHEVGHNMGCDHDRDHTSSSGAYSYSYEYEVVGVFRTIMIYAPPLVGYFSNPNVLYSGLSMGVPEGQPDSADNAKTINNTKSIVANFRNLVISCTYSISPASNAFNSSSGTSSVSVTATSGCSWTAISNNSWITITSGSSGSGNGTVNYSVLPNTSTSSRNGTMTIAGKTFTVSQAGVPCSHSFSPTSVTFDPSGGTGSVSVTAPVICSWITYSSTSWITVTSARIRTGNGTVNYSVSANRSGISRTGTIIITRSLTPTTEDIFTVSQSGVGTGLTPPSLDIKANGFDGPIILGTKDNLLVNASLTAGESWGLDSDWWVAADTPFGWFYLDVGTMNWTYAGVSYTDLSPTYQWPLFDLSTFEVLNMTDLPEGTYTFYFAVDTNMNGVLDFGELFSDSVVVNITP